MGRQVDREGVTALPNSSALPQLWDPLGPKLIEAAQGQLSSKQVVASSSLVSRPTGTAALNIIH